MFNVIVGVIGVVVGGIGLVANRLTALTGRRHVVGVRH
jgi:hypothetical protein